MDPSEYYEFEDRAYVSPTVSRDEQLNFVNTLRDTVDSNTAQINAQTQDLGTNITSNLGGLTGSDGYFAQRYQTTPVESQVNTLKATAQAKALNDLMTNYQNQAANRYNQAYRNAKARAAAGGGGGGDDGDGDGLPDNVETEETGDGTSVDVDDNTVTLADPKSTDSDPLVSAINQQAQITGGSKIPGISYTPYYYELNGKRTAFTVNKTPFGVGIDTPLRSYTQQAAKEHLQGIMRQGGRIYNQYGKDITDLALGQMGLY